MFSGSRQEKGSVGIPVPQDPMTHPKQPRVTQEQWPPGGPSQGRAVEEQ